MSAVPSAGGDYVHFYTSKKPNSAETIHVYNPFDKKTYSAEVRPGSQNLKGRVETLETYKKDLESAKSLKGKLLRLAGVLMIAGLVAGIAVGLALGIKPLAIGSGALLGLLGFGYNIHKDPRNGYLQLVLSPLGIFNFLDDMVNMEKKGASKIDSQKKEIEATIRYLREHKPQIETWLVEQKKKLEDGITAKKGEMNDLPDHHGLRDLGESMGYAEAAIDHINKVLESLTNSLSEAAQFERGK